MCLIEDQSWIDCIDITSRWDTFVLFHLYGNKGVSLPLWPIRPRWFHTFSPCAEPLGDGHEGMGARFGSQGSIALNWHSRYSGTRYSGTWLYILFKFVKSLIRHLGLAIGNVRYVRWFSWTLSPGHNELINLILPLLMMWQAHIDPSDKCHHALDKYPTMHNFVTEMFTHAHFCYKMMHCGIWDWCMVGFVQQAYWNVLQWSNNSYPYMVIVLIGPLEKTYWNLQTKYKTFHQRKDIWKCGLHNDDHFVHASMCYIKRQINRLVQERRNSIANALELRLSCTNPSRHHISYSYLIFFIENYEWSFELRTWRKLEIFNISRDDLTITDQVALQKQINKATPSMPHPLLAPGGSWCNFKW